MTSMHGIPFEKHETLRFGLIGAGERGRSLLYELLGCEGVEVKAVADINPEAVERANQRVTGAFGPFGPRPAPKLYSGENAWRSLLEEDLDLVYIATPWDLHAPFAAAAMEAGKHVGVEVPAAVTLEECWQLVETSERTRRHCVMLENCCYDYWETLVRRMVSAGLLGTITHAECAYIHDLRGMLLADYSEGLWRRQPHLTRNGNHYPTHGLGPVAQILGIGAITPSHSLGPDAPILGISAITPSHSLGLDAPIPGIGGEDAFDYLVSMSSLPAGLAEYRDQTVPAGDPKRTERYICGDMNVSLIRTKMGRTIVLQHSVANPRPYDRIFLIAGTRGAFRDYPPRLYLEGIGTAEEWLPLDEYRAQWEDPLWKNFGEQARRQGGHGGMDFIMNYRLVQIMREGLPPDSDVYDAAEWSAPGPLSEQSVRQKSAPVDFPDFR